jgi:hypothetical protein
MKVYFITGDAEFFKNKKTTKHDFSSLLELPDFPKEKVIINEFQNNYHPSEYVDELIKALDYYEPKRKSIVFVSFDLILFDSLRVLVKRGKIDPEDLFIYERVRVQGKDQWDHHLIDNDGRIIGSFPKVFNVIDYLLMEMLG